MTINKCSGCNREIKSTQSQIGINIFKQNKDGRIAKRQFNYRYHIICQPRVHGMILK